MALKHDWRGTNNKELLQTQHTWTSSSFQFLAMLLRDFQKCKAQYDNITECPSPKYTREYHVLEDIFILDVHDDRPNGYKCIKNPSNLLFNFIINYFGVNKIELRFFHFYPPPPMYLFDFYPNQKYDLAWCGDLSFK